jgi:flagellar basal body-associated protein FliL
MKKSYWVIFAIVLFVLVLIVVLTIFLISNKSDTASQNQQEMARILYSTDMNPVNASPSDNARPQGSHSLVRL